MSPADATEYYHTLFEHAPISLWEEDYSGIKRLLDGLRREGVQSLEAYLEAHPDFVERCMHQIRVLDVNQQTLAMFRAGSKEEMLASLKRVFRDGMRAHFRSELLAHWAGELAWSGEGVNYTLDGEALDILLHWRILPGYEQTWERVLVTIENITARKRAERRLQDLFSAAPISLWEEDYSAVRECLDDLRREGVTNLQAYLEKHPEVVSRCMGLIRVLDVNRKTLELFRAESREHMLGNLDKVLRDEMKVHFARELVDLWNGKLAYEREGINYALDGEPLNIHLDFRVMPGHEQDFGWVLVAIQDITARKKAEDYLRYLGTHDVMTGMYNRAYFTEILQRLDKEQVRPVSLVVADLNGLKQVNDLYGHQAGDDYIRRAAEVLKAVCDEHCVAARIGGDEFAVCMPGADAQAAGEALERIRQLMALNNKYYREPELSISLGAATSQPDLPLEKVINLADDAMYRDKGEHYRRRREDR